MKRWSIRLVVVLGLAALGWYLSQTTFAAKPLEVVTVAAEMGLVEETVTNSRAGTVEARRRAKLSPEIGGTVVELPFREGSQVAKGDVLLRLDDSLPRARLEVARRELDAAEGERERSCLSADRAKRELERVRGLVATGIVSTDRLDQLESVSMTSDASCGASKSNVARAHSGVGLAQAELAKMAIRAPFAGIIATLTTEVGEYSTPSPPAVPVPAVIDLLDQTSVYIAAPMDEVDSARIEPGQAVRVTVDSYRGEEFPGRVVRVAPFVLDLEEQNRTVEIEVELDDAAFAATLLPGTSADVEAVIERRENVLRLPTSCLIEGHDVLVLSDGVLRRIEVQAGLRNWAFTEIRDGIEEGARVVTSLDSLEIRDGVEAVEAGTVEAGTVEAGDGGQ